MSRQTHAPALVRGAALWALALAGAPAAFADPASYVFVPYSIAGKWQLAYGIGTAHGRDGERETQQTLSLGGTPTARWTTSAYAAWAASDGGAWAPDEWTWVNHFKLSAPGSTPLDVGLLCELAKSHDHDVGRSVACGPTLQMDTDDLQLNLNLALAKHFDAADAEPVQMGYQWQVKALLTKGIELGAQGFGAVGPWNHWSPASQQEHTLGPAIFAKTSLAGFPITVDAAWLLGLGDGSPKNVIRLRIQQEF
jgi:hypothetical protein